MAQFKSVEVSISVKETAFSGTAMDRAAFPTRVNTYTETYDNLPSVKWATENIVAGLLEVLVPSVSAVTYYDTNTGVRVKVAYTIKAKTAGSISAVGVSAETGAAAIAKGCKHAKKLSKNARRRMARYGK